MDHLFFALGYEDLRHDVAKSGREIDVHGNHRIEPRQMRAECKAHKKKMGGDEVSKFRGALLAEQITAGKQPIVGYFISLGGFTESAIEQEKTLGRKRIILIDAPRIIKELERSHVLVSDTQAAEQAGRCVQRMGLHNLEVDGVELLGHELGYIKAVYYSYNKERTHFALIFADGDPLAERTAGEVIEADEAAGGLLHRLHYLAPEPIAPDSHTIEAHALRLYQAWIAQECGVILLDGLPVDEKLSPKPLRLEKLFVPLKASVEDVPQYYPQSEHLIQGRAHEYPLGELLTAHKRLALLAAPGGGKSTLLKRLAMAYAFPSQRPEIDDLPDRQWLPLFLRCRELRDRTAYPILRLLEDVPSQLNMPEAEVIGFQRVLHESLQNGRLLLLVDGLDEIWEEGPRKTFANNLRAFTSIYPHVQLVVTSREAGFRVVASVIADVCQRATLAPLDEADIYRLCLQWHVEVLNDSQSVRKEARELARVICNNHNIFPLAVNPLLLTTLLIVKRSIGELPTYRAALYAEAVKLLVKTWNIEGHNALNERETFAQLCYVACVMMEQNLKQITQPKLLELLQDSREVLAAELQRTTISPEEFLNQVEHRSSLLMLTGRKMEAGELQPIYEFRHLTFQEFLAARGYFKDQHPRRREGLSLTDLLAPKFMEASWREVIALAAVQAEYRAEPLIQRLIDVSAQIQLDEEYELSNEGFDILSLLLQCVLDEVTIAPATLREAVRQLARFASDPVFLESLQELAGGSLWPLLLEVTEESFLSGSEHWVQFGDAYKELAFIELTEYPVAEVEFSRSEYIEYISIFELDLVNPAGIDAIRAATNFASMAYTWYLPRMRSGRPKRDLFSRKRATDLLQAFEQMVRTGNVASIYAACYAIMQGYQGLYLLGPASINPDLPLLLLNAWLASKDPELNRTIANAIGNLPLLKRETLLEAGADVNTYQDFLIQKLNTTKKGRINTYESKAATSIIWYLKGPLSEQELAKKILEIHENSEGAGAEFYDRWMLEELARSATMLEAMGKLGRQALTYRAQRIAKKKALQEKLGDDDLPF
jgi:hypothetical protein